MYHLIVNKEALGVKYTPPVLDSKAIRVPFWPISPCISQDLGLRPRMLHVSVSQAPWDLVLVCLSNYLLSPFPVLCAAAFGLSCSVCHGHRITCLLFLQSQGQIVCPTQSDAFLGPHRPGALSLLSPATLVFCLALSTARKMLLFTDISHGVRSILTEVCP